MNQNTYQMPSVSMVSFVIPQKGRLDLLERTLMSIAAQKLDLDDNDNRPPCIVEVIIVTQDDNPEVALSLVNRVLGDIEGIDLHFLQANEDEQTISSLRNRAARASKGQLLAFIDADISLSPNWVVAMRDVLFTHESCVLVGAMQVADAEPTVIESIQVELNRMKVDKEVHAMSGHNLLVRKETFEEAGGFPEHLGTCEDSVFTDKVSRFGKLFRSSQAFYVHLGEDRNFGDVFRKEKWRSRYNFSTLQGRDVRLIEMISFIAPMVVVFALGLFSFTVFLGQFIPAVLWLVLALAPVLAFSVRLQLSARRRLKFSNIFRFYLVYFIARGIGMVQGIPNALRARFAADKNVSGSVM